MLAPDVGDSFPLTPFPIQLPINGLRKVVKNEPNDWTPVVGKTLVRKSGRLPLLLSHMEKKFPFIQINKQRQKLPALGIRKGLLREKEKILHVISFKSKSGVQ